MLLVLVHDDDVGHSTNYLNYLYIYGFQPIFSTTHTHSAFIPIQGDDTFIPTQSDDTFIPIQ